MIAVLDLSNLLGALARFGFLSLSPSIPLNANFSAKAIMSESNSGDVSNLLKPTSENGADFGSYNFGQSLGSVDVFVPFQSGIKSRDVDVRISSTSLRVGLKGQAPVIDGKLHDKVKADDCTWTLVDNKVVHVYLEKVDGMKWWSSVVSGGKEIDTKLIVPENSKLSDLDGDMRQTVEKMMFDQRQKAMGLPTSDEAEKAKMLEKFKQQHPELDFSKAKINFGGNNEGSGFSL